MALILSGPFGDWNSGLLCGLWSYFLEFMLLSFAYLTLALCLAEMTSIVAFASGAYGYVRCSVGPFYGYMMACCELLENSFVSITCALSVSQAMTITTGLSKSYEPLWLFLYYVLTFAVQCRGGWYFWTAMVVFGGCSALVLVLYCFSVITTENLSRIDLINDPYEKFVGGGRGFFQNFYYPMWLYIGTEAMTIAGKNISNGPDVIPRVLVATFVTAFCLNVWTIFSTVIEYTNNGWFELSQYPLPLSFGFKDNIKAPYDIGAALVLAPTFASGLGFLYASMHLTQAMSLSGLVSPFFQATVGEAKIPMRSLMTNCAVQLVVAIIGWAASDAPPFYQICAMSACVVYVGIFTAYLTFHYKFGNMVRQFHSPLGVYGAFYGLVLFTLTFFEIAVDTIDQYVVVVFVAVMLAAAVYYVAVVDARQFFSPEEQKRFMKAYILNGKETAVAGGVPWCLCSVRELTANGAMVAVCCLLCYSQQEEENGQCDVHALGTQHGQCGYLVWWCRRTRQLVDGQFGAVEDEWHTDDESGGDGLETEPNRRIIFCGGGGGGGTPDCSTPRGPTSSGGRRGSCPSSGGGDRWNCPRRSYRSTVPTLAAAVQTSPVHVAITVVLDERSTATTAAATTATAVSASLVARVVGQSPGRPPQPTVSRVYHRVDEDADGGGG